MGGLEALFNNAGVGVAGPIDRISAADAMWIVSVNLIGVINGVRSFTPLLRAAAAAGRKAWIVNTGSEHSLGVPTIGASNVYTATKHAILGLTDVLRHDLKGSGIRAAVLCPGLVATNIFDARRNRPDTFGGPRRMDSEQAAKARAMMSDGQAPALTAQLCFEGLTRGDFIIITDPKVGRFVRARLVELEQAVDLIEQRLA
jgi:NAD(P)-dependent dehydrogenase (short-subunit alcohol dehydrogenase family)